MERQVAVTPINTGNNGYKLGLWVKDAATGVGTISFYNPENGKFASLGHGIVDSDTGNFIQIKYGEITNTDIVSITKGMAGAPGEVKGIIKNEEVVGEITENTEFGLFGKINNLELLNNEFNSEFDVGIRSELHEGKASILSDIDGEEKEYEVEIKKIYLNNNYDNKSFVIEVTDEDLINETGGIIRGLSGSPILQDGKLVRSCYKCTCFKS